MPNVKWGYAINQFLATDEHLTKRKEHERAFKVMSVCGFREVELRIGFGRWSPLGTPEMIELNFGSFKDLKDFLMCCGIDQVVSYYFGDGGGQSYENMVDAAEPFAKFLGEIGGNLLVVRPTQSYWKVAPVTDKKIKEAAKCWNKVGKMTAKYRVQTTLHIDFLSAVRTVENIEKMLKFTNPEHVGLTIDTAEAVISGNDPTEMYERFHERVNHFHFKDTHNVDDQEEYKGENADILLADGGGKQGVERWFWEMGTPEGLVDFESLMGSLKKHGYKGSIIVESDQTPCPSASAMLNSWYVKNILSKIYN